MNNNIDAVLRNIILDNGEKSAMNILSRLRFISKIGPNQKVDVSSLTFMEHNLYTRIYRTVYNCETKYTTLNFIRSAIDDSITLAEFCLSNGKNVHLEIFKQVIECLREVKVGLSNLTGTYKSYPSYISDIQSLISLVDIKIQQLESKFSKKNNKV